jgi:hypothetical protein
VHITEPSDLVAYDVSLKLPATDTPITGVRVVFYPDKKHAGGWGYGPAEKKSKKRAARKSDARRDSPSPARPEATTPPEDSAEQPKVKGNFVLTSFSASADAVPGDQVNLHRLLGIRQVTASSWQAEYPVENCLDTRNENGWSPDPAQDGPVHLTVTFKEPLRAAETPYMTVQVNFGHGKSLVASRFDVLALTGSDDGSSLPPEMIAILTDRTQQSVDNSPAGRGVGTRRRSAEQVQRLRDYYTAHAIATRGRRIAITNLEERLAVLTQEFPTMVMDIASQPRNTYILHRGDYAQPREKVTTGTPATLPPPPRDAPSNRLGLAQWITMRGHPLTARVAVNRFWQMLFGIGLVRTTADFGAQGEYPSHPELLDWLATDFMDCGWDVKSTIRKMVLSATYRQASVASPELLQRDPQNRLLARGPRFRLSAELIRDGALKVSGLLVPRIGGPSVNPYMPADLWREISHFGSTPATAQSFVQDHGEKLYRRSLYTFWKRTAPPPNMSVFDAPNREVCVVSRPSTTTPLQALVLLNDVQFVEASRAFAQRILLREGDDTAKLRWASAECLSRWPTERELSVMTAALRRERARYSADEAAARAFLANGESPRNETLPVAEHAAWSQVAALLLNLSETVTRN